MGLSAGLWAVHAIFDPSGDHDARRAEFSIDGGRWQEIHPRDGINDALEESYDIPLSELTGPSPHIVVVRASDLLGNLSTERVEVP